MAFVDTLQAKLSELLGHRSEPALVPLMDLRDVHPVAAGVSVDLQSCRMAWSAASAQSLKSVVTSVRTSV